MAGFDLHVHSHFSDGEHDVKALAAIAKEAGLSGFAVTDHDTVAGLAGIEAIGATMGMRILPGLEISTEHEGGEVHILAYRFRREDPDLLSGLAFLEKARIGRVAEMVARIAGLGYALSLAEVEAASTEGTIGRPHIASVLVRKGAFPSVAAAFAALLVPGKPGFVPRVKFSPHEAVALVRAAGGAPVLAHPGIDEAHRFVPELVEAGLMGLEACHSSHSPAQQRFFGNGRKPWPFLYRRFRLSRP